MRMSLKIIATTCQTTVSICQKNMSRVSVDLSAQSLQDRISKARTQDRSSRPGQVLEPVGHLPLDRPALDAADDRHGA
jgi:hypothetical protein